MNTVILGNIVNARIMEALEQSREKAFREGLKFWTVDPAWLDVQVEWMYEAVDQQLSKNRLREHLVQFILKEFTASIFGVDNGVGR